MFQLGRSEFYKVLPSGFVLTLFYAS